MIALSVLRQVSALTIGSLIRRFDASAKRPSPSDLSHVLGRLRRAGLIHRPVRRNSSGGDPGQHPFSGLGRDHEERAKG